jgi:hypothetical protein
MSDSTLEELAPFIETFYKKISEDETELEIPIVISTESGFHEDVSDLNGIAIPCIYTDKILNQNSLYNIIENSLKEFRPGEHVYLKEMFKKAARETVKVEDYLYLANIYSSIQEKLYFKLSQIHRNEYTWLKDDIIEICMNRLTTIIKRDVYIPEVEVTIIHPNMDEELDEIHRVLDPYFLKDRFIFTARMDMVCDDIWELKCTTMVSEHFLQMMIYAWLWKVIHPSEERKFKIFNIKTGEIYLLEKSSLHDLTPLIVLILKSKYEKLKRKTDHEFLEQFDCAGTIPCAGNNV